MTFRPLIQDDAEVLEGQHHMEKMCCVEIEHESCEQLCKKTAGTCRGEPSADDSASREGSPDGSSSTSDQSLESLGLNLQESEGI